MEAPSLAGANHSKTSTTLREFFKERGVVFGKTEKGAEAKKAQQFRKYSTEIDKLVTVIAKDNLQEWVVNSFKDGYYRTVVTNEDITVYRVFGNNARATGAFTTSKPSLNRIQTKIDSAILPEWKNSLHYEAEIVIPKGTKLNIGKVEKQFTKSGTELFGNADQFLMPENWNNSWIKNIREVKP